MDDFSKGNQNGSVDSPRKKDQNGLSHHLGGWEKDEDSLSKDQKSPQHLLKVEEVAHGNGNECRDASTPCNGASLFDTVTSVFTDKNVMELPELEVCYREIHHQIVKDICVDDGRAEDKNLIETYKDDKSGHHFPQSHCNSNHGEDTGGVDKELIVSDGIEASLMENTSAIQCGSKEENDGKLVDQGRLESPSDSSGYKDTAKHCDTGDSVQKGEANCGETTGKAATSSSEEVSLVDRELPIQEFGTRSFLRSFLNSLDDEGNKVTQPPDQIPNGKACTKSHTASSAEKQGPKEDVQASSLLYNSKEHEDADADNLPDAGQVRSAGGSTGDVQEPSLIIKNGNFNGSSATSHVPPVGIKERSEENVHEQTPENKDDNSADLSQDCQLQFPNNKGESSRKDDVQALEPNVPRHEHRNSGNVSVVSQLQHDAGETSFSAADLISYSGQIAYSGSLSHRSDASTTSARSFAFPVLQSEWNSSPVRMAKADRRHFRKHKGWRLGLLCCRF
ncbi:hypothetical protein Salat_1312400 [Sesamum alatum]|uniref:18S pre-ribosomal assembly protein gar2-related n=1 Tax=Sesamum alatum TaxID=300844 RepID=A0AAE1YHF2_9LAMI|nr:hypothetical protein Salat_1312400 [Sesamum alatum]